jgi:uracil-DNA glycosylase family 4
MPARRRPKPRVNEVPAYGPVRSRLYVLGERAGAEEDRRGVPFVGPSGKSLREWFESAGLELDKVRRWNVCIDYKPGNLKPLAWEIERDRLAVETDIVRCQPNVIVAVGVHATKWCLGRRVKLGTVHGRKFEVQIGDHKAFCVPIYHPSTYGRIERAEMGKDDVLTVAWVLRSLIA